LSSADSTKHSSGSRKGHNYLGRGHRLQIKNRKYAEESSSSIASNSSDDNVYPVLKKSSKYNLVPSMYRVID